MMTSLSILLAITVIATTSAFTGGAYAAEAQSRAQAIAKNGSQASMKGPEAFFTGNVRVDPLLPADGEINASAAYVTFEPGARSAWHTHPSGQKLIVISGLGRTQQWGGPIVEIMPGDVVTCPTNVKHWHGASPNMPMTHIALTGADSDGKNVEWMEKVTDEQYNAKQ